MVLVIKPYGLMNVNGILCYPVSHNEILKMIFRVIQLPTSVSPLNRYD